MGATCVIKQFLPQLSGTEAIHKAVELFNQEAVRLYELGEHSQIPTLMAYFSQDNRQYLVQEFIAGKTLLQELEAEGPFPETKIWKVLTDILPVLQFVHERNVIHRDITPVNIIRRHSDGLPVLIDFGVAKLLQSVTSPQTGGTIIGSPGYMPMELHTEGKVYPASDLYGLGTTVFHLLTGVSPHWLFIKYGFSWLPQWQKYLQAPISDALIYVLSKLLKEEVGDRYSSAEEVLRDIERLHKRPEPQVAGVSDEEFIESFLQEVWNTLSWIMLALAFLAFSFLVLWGTWNLLNYTIHFAGWLLTGALSIPGSIFKILVNFGLSVFSATGHGISSLSGHIVHFTSWLWAGVSSILVAFSNALTNLGAWAFSVVGRGISLLLGYVVHFADWLWAGANSIPIAVFKALKNFGGWTFSATGQELSFLLGYVVHFTSWLWAGVSSIPVAVFKALTNFSTWAFSAVGQGLSLLLGYVVHFAGWLWASASSIPVTVFKALANFST
ncbi:MAG: protein kinase [Oscillatoriales cyanobacterium SM2_1_8]|nr:protein kinase [Oscillatoriales cyanobacterium SM2_1_8]